MRVSKRIPLFLMAYRVIVSLHDASTPLRSDVSSGSYVSPLIRISFMHPKKALSAPGALVIADLKSGGIPPK